MEHLNQVDPNYLKASWAKERNRLFGIVEQLVLWENSANENVLEKARKEIHKSWLETCEANKNHELAPILFRSDKFPDV